jgi:DNA-binding GntR family transcriptional regulator
MVPRKIFELLRSEIVQGALPPGAELRQEELAARFGASRIPVREALRLLEAEDLVAFGPNRSACVVALSIDEVDEIFHLRLLLETDCLTRAAGRMSESDLALIERARRRAEIDAGTNGWSDSDMAFHAALYAPADRPRQIALIRRLRMTSELQAPAYQRLPGETARWLADHMAIVEACRVRRTDDAVAILRDHIEGARRIVLDAMRS